MTNQDSDSNECLNKASLGDEVARSQLLEKHRDRLKRMVALRIDRRLMKRIDPSDIIQETLVLADRRLDAYLRERPIPFLSIPVSD